MKKTFMAAGLAAVLLGGLLVLGKQDNDSVIESNTAAVTDAPENNPLPTEMEDDPVALTVSSFMDNFIKSAPPAADASALQTAAGFLSAGARSNMSGEPTSGDLAGMLGVQDVPDQGYEIGEIVYKENAATGKDDLAEVKITLKFSGGDTKRTFLLSMAGDSWNIDGVSKDVE